MIREGSYQIGNVGWGSTYGGSIFMKFKKERNDT